MSSNLCQTCLFCTKPYDVLDSSRLRYCCVWIAQVTSLRPFSVSYDQSFRHPCWVGLVPALWQKKPILKIDALFTQNHFQIWNQNTRIWFFSHWQLQWIQEILNNYSIRRTAPSTDGDLPAAICFSYSFKTQTTPVFDATDHNCGSRTRPVCLYIYIYITSRYCYTSEKSLRDNLWHRTAP